MYQLASKLLDHLVAKTAVQLLLVLSLVAQVGLPSRAGAEEEEEARSGAYVGAGFAVGLERFEPRGIRQTDKNGDVINLNFESGFGADGFVGYRITPRLAAELQVEYLNGFNEPVQRTEQEIITFTGNLKGYLTTGPVQVYALVGVGLMHFQIQEDRGRKGIRMTQIDDLAVRIGGGVDVYQTPNSSLGMSISYVLDTHTRGFDPDPVTNDIYRFDYDYSYLSLQFGYTYRF